MPQAYVYSAREYGNMLMCLGEALGNASLALRIYRNRFPNVRHPSDSRMIMAAFQRVLENRPIAAGGGQQVNVQTEERILNVIRQNPRLGTRSAAKLLRRRGLPTVSHWTVHKVLRRNRMRPYKIHKVQALLPNDRIRRRAYCRWLLDQQQRAPGFIEHNIVTSSNRKKATTKQLRRLWMNTKQRQRDALTKERQHRMVTGGGPSISDATIDHDVAEVVPALIVGIDTAIDSDAVFEITEDHMMQPIYTEEVPADAPLEPVVVVTETPLQTFTPASETETAPTLVRRPTALTGQRHKASILEREYRDRQKRANEKHEIEIKILGQQLRETKAKAELAELILQQQRSSDLMS